MKKILLTCLMCICIFAFYSCAQTHYFKPDNKQQEDFDNFLKKKCEASYSQNNDIQEKEYINLFEKELFNYIDSIGLFVNWEGVISDIKTQEIGNTTELSFVIGYQPEQYRKIEFHCLHLVSTDSLSNDYIFNTVKNMPNYMIVHFDGFIRTKNNGVVDYYLGNSGDDLNISYPDYDFWVIDISPEKRSDTLSSKLRNAVNIAYKINEPLKAKYLGLITDEESQKQFDELLPKFNQAKQELTIAEKQYIQRLNTCLTYNYLYGE
ncbi:MAG: hypothetical protein PHX61_00690 [Alphaproteobacteria bacterium]|nr:hypothetical protein [Alphaproteobacteria bacterium]